MHPSRSLKTHTQIVANLLKIFAVTISLVAFGCAAETSEDGTADGPAATSSTPAKDPQSDAASSSGDSVEAAGLRFALPEGWKRQQPSSSMRAAQASIEGPGGAGELTVFFFGAGGGGGVDANLNRWVGQMQDAEAPPSRNEFETGDFLVTTISHKGTLKASTMGTFPSTDQPDYALLGAVVEGPGGPWFFKAIGPESTLSQQESAFRSMLQNVSAAD